MVAVFVGPSCLRGDVTPPPSKSVAHRALTAAALASRGPAGMALIKGVSADTSQDIGATMNCLNALFAETSGKVRLNCQESGTTLRFMVPLAAALGKEAIFTGTGRLAQRPLSEYTDIFQGKGVELDFSRAQGSLPLFLRGRLRSGRFLVPGHISSQYVSGLLLALPLLTAASVIELTSPLQSAPYVDLTLAILTKFGVKATPLSSADGAVAGWRLDGNQEYRLPDAAFPVEADYSQGAFWLVAKYLGHPLTVSGLCPNSLQGDRAIIELLVRLQANDNELETIDAGQFPDLAPVLAVAACHAPKTTVIANAGRLRLKESDRLAATAEGLSRLGAMIKETSDSMIITGGTRLKGGAVDAYNDHRIVMAMAIAALNSESGVTINGAEAVAKSYPNFFSELKRLGGNSDDLNMG